MKVVESSVERITHREVPIAELAELEAISGARNTGRLNRRGKTWTQR